MCLVTKQKTPTKTKEDTIVYKHCYMYDNNENEVYSTNDFLYEKGILNETELVINNIRDSVADHLVFLHYKIDIWEWKYESTDDVFKHVHEGFHSAKTKERISFYLWGTLCEFTIPKGSLIMEDETGLITSNKIIFNKIIK